MCSLDRSSARSAANFCAQGWISPGFRSAATLRSYLKEILCQMPERSGLPSAVRGAAAVRFGLPFAVRGVAGGGWVTHCAATGRVTAEKITTKTTVFIRDLLAYSRPGCFHILYHETLLSAWCREDGGQHKYFAGYGDNESANLTVAHEHSSL